MEYSVLSRLHAMRDGQYYTAISRYDSTDRHFSSCLLGFLSGFFPALSYYPVKYGIPSLITAQDGTNVGSPKANLPPFGSSHGVVMQHTSITPQGLLLEESME